MVEGKCCPRCPCPCNTERSENNQSGASRRFGNGTGGTGNPQTSTPSRPQTSELHNRLERTRERLETLMGSHSQERSGGSAGHSNTLALNELMILRRKLQILETRIAILEERMPSGNAAGSRNSSSRSLETLKQNVIRAVTFEFDHFDQ